MRLDALKIRRVAFDKLIMGTSQTLPMLLLMKTVHIVTMSFWNKIIIMY